MQLSVATTHLNSRIRSRGLSAREMWYHRDQSTNEHIPVSDNELVMKQNAARKANHLPSARSKAKDHELQPHPSFKVGDIVHLKSERNKHKARDKYLVVSMEGEWCYVRKFVG